MGMKILQAVNFTGSDTANPYIRSLVDGLRKAGHCVAWSADDFWTAEGRFDIVHIHWRGKTCKSALDVHKLFSAEVRTETCFCDTVIAEFKSEFCCSY